MHGGTQIHRWHSFLVWSLFDLGKSYIPQKKAFKQINDSAFEIESNLAQKDTILIIVKKFLGSLSGFLQLCMMTMPPILLAQTIWISVLSNEVKQISEFKVFFTKFAKNLTKFASKNLGVRK